MAVNWPCYCPKSCLITVILVIEVPGIFQKFPKMISFVKVLDFFFVPEGQIIRDPVIVFSVPNVLRIVEMQSPRQEDQFLRGIL